MVIVNSVSCLTIISKSNKVGLIKIKIKKETHFSMTNVDKKVRMNKARFVIYVAFLNCTVM